MKVHRMILGLCLIGIFGCAAQKSMDMKEGYSESGVITFEEVQKSTGRSAFDVITQYKPQWLVGRGTKTVKNGSLNYPVVYLDDTRYGDVTSLKEIRPHDIREIAYLGASDATIRFGIDHIAGAILVTSL